MTKWNQLRRALGSANSGDSCDLERIALGRFQTPHTTDRSSLHANKRVRRSGARCGCLRGDVHHAHAPLFIVVRKFRHNIWCAGISVELAFESVGECLTPAATVPQQLAALLDDVSETQNNPLRINTSAISPAAYTSFASCTTKKQFPLTTDPMSPEPSQ